MPDLLFGSTGNPDDGHSDSEPREGERYIAEDNVGAITALVNDRYPVPQGAFFVTIRRVWSDEEKVQVGPDWLWLSFADLRRWFRRVPGGTA